MGVVLALCYMSSLWMSRSPNQINYAPLMFIMKMQLHIEMSIHNRWNHTSLIFSGYVFIKVHWFMFFAYTSCPVAIMHGVQVWSILPWSLDVPPENLSNLVLCNCFWCNLAQRKLYLACSSDHTTVEKNLVSPRLQDKIWEWPGDKANY